MTEQRWAWVAARLEAAPFQSTTPSSGAEARTRFRRLNGTNKFVPFPSPFMMRLVASRIAGSAPFAIL
jgi:hypothetical protein